MSRMRPRLCGMKSSTGKRWTDERSRSSASTQFQNVCDAESDELGAIVPNYSNWKILNPYNSGLLQRASKTRRVDREWKARLKNVVGGYRLVHSARRGQSRIGPTLNFATNLQAVLESPNISLIGDKRMGNRVVPPDGLVPFHRLHVKMVAALEVAFKGKLTKSGFKPAKVDLFRTDGS